MTEEDRKKSKELEAEYTKVLKDFAIQYVALWNALKSLGLTDPQIKGAISNILENGGGTMKDSLREAKQMRNEKMWKELYEG